MSASLALGDLSPAQAPVPAPLQTTEIAAGMLATLDTLTMAGQQHMMARIAGLLAAEAQRHSQPIRWFDGLAREAHRLAPDVAAFRRQAEPILAALGDNVS